MYSNSIRIIGDILRYLATTKLIISLDYEQQTISHETDVCQSHLAFLRTAWNLGKAFAMLDLSSRSFLSLFKIVLGLVS